MPKYFESESITIQINEFAESKLAKMRYHELVPGEGSEIRSAYAAGVKDAIKCIDDAEGEEIVTGIRCGKCEHWHRQSKKHDIGYCMAVYENDFPFHCDHPPITGEDFSCGFARKKEQETDVT